MQSHDFTVRGINVYTNRKSDGYFYTLTNSIPVGIDSVLSGSNGGRLDRSKPKAFSYTIHRGYGIRGTRSKLTSNSNDSSWSLSEESGALFDPSVRAHLLKVNSDEVYNDALAKLMSAAKSSNFNSSVALGELKETSAIGREILHHTRRFTERLRFSGPLAAIKVSSRLFSEAFLSYKYAIRPLVSDLYSAMDLIHNNRDGFNQKLGPCTSSKTLVWEESGEDTVGEPYKVVRKERYLVKFGGAREILNPLDDSAWRAGLDNPFLTAWELLPLSFVADWFVDVGGTLDLLGSAVSLNRNGNFSGYCSRLQLIEDSFSSRWFSQSNQGAISTTSQCDWAGKTKYVSFTRDLLSSFPLPFSPSLSVPDTTSRLLSAAALLRTIGIKG